MASDSDAGSSSVENEKKVSSPSHRLMKTARLVLDDTFRNDYLSKRYRWYQSIKPPTETSVDSQQLQDFWCGATSVEQALIACADFSNTTSTASNINGVHNVRGALNSEHALRFVEILAMYAHSLSLRSLGLAMLEATHELDQEDAPVRVTYKSEGDPAETDEAESKMKANNQEVKAAENKSDGSTDGGQKSQKPEGTAGKQDTKEGAENEDDNDDDDTELPYVRLKAFISAGGLRILSQWLVDASTPTVGPPVTKPTNKAPRKVPSATSAILLPLIELLNEMPIDKESVVDSKINKHIKKLTKVLQPANDETEEELDKITKERLRLIAGESATPYEVLQALTSLKKTWEEEVKRQARVEEPETQPNPLTGLLDQIRDHSKQIADFEDGNSETCPDFWEVPTEKELANSRPAKRRQTIAERARLERQKEKAAGLRESLREAMEKRQETYERLQQIQHKQQMTASVAVSSVANRRRIKWKDGFGPASEQRNRNVLEEVRLFVTDKNVYVPNEEIEILDDDDDEV